MRVNFCIFGTVRKEVDKMNGETYLIGRRVHMKSFTHAINNIWTISTLWYPTKKILECVTQFFPALRYRQHLSDFLLQFDVTWHVWYMYLIYKKVSRNSWMKIRFNKSISRNFCLSIHDRKYNRITNLYIYFIII